MNDIYQQFRNQAEHLSVRPRPEAWGKVQMKLTVYRGRRKLAMFRLISIAAGILLCVAVSISVWLYTQQATNLSSFTYALTIEELRMEESGESIYDIGNIRRSYSELMPAYQ
jgi:hypothetical protein